MVRAAGTFGQQHPLKSLLHFSLQFQINMNNTLALSSTDAEKASVFSVARTDGFVKVRSRNADGLWQRNERFYCQMQVPGKGNRRIPLRGEDNLPVKTVAEAKEARDALLLGKRRGELPGPRITPEFTGYFMRYIKWLDDAKAKSPLTILKERSSLNSLAKFFKDTRLDQISRQKINEYVTHRHTPKDDKKRVTNRTINLEILALNHLLKFGKDEGWLKGILPTENWKDLKHVTPKRTLIPDDAVEKLCAAALTSKLDANQQPVLDKDGKPQPKYENGPLFADWIKLMAFSGARRKASLSAKWDQIDWNNRQIAFYTKFDKKVIVDFNDKLEAHLNDMLARKGDSPWMFPSPRAGETVYLQTPTKTFDAIKKDAGLESITPHDFRHWFISYCVMSGIDFMTIAKWVGHADGGILIGKVYGHLSNAHAQAAAKKIVFGAAPKEKNLNPAPANNSGEDLSAEELLALLQRKMASQLQPEK